MPSELPKVNVRKTKTHGSVSGDPDPAIRYGVIPAQKRKGLGLNLGQEGDKDDMFDPDQDEDEVGG